MAPYSPWWLHPDKTETMAVHIPDLCADLAAETDVLVTVLEGLDETGWSTPTPAEGWTVKDQIGHLAYFDRAVVTAITGPEKFRADLAVAMSGGGNFVEDIAAESRQRSGSETLSNFTSARAVMVETFLHTDLSTRVPWYGPDMSVASALTARNMETWAHGQDVFDSLDIDHPITTALRQVAHIGVRALPNSFVTRGLPVPAEPVRLALRGPDGSEWVWGPEDAVDRVTGPALDFCLIVTQRRHPADTEIVAEGDVATTWMSIAQAFAGPPGTGRRPGHLRR